MAQLIQSTQLIQPHVHNRFAATTTLSTERFIQSLALQPPKPLQPSDWHTGLVNRCSDNGGCGFCLLATFCPCVAYGMNYSLLVGDKACDIRRCCCPCMLFSILCMLSSGDTKDKNPGVDYAGLAQSSMIYNHRYAVGKRTGIYQPDSVCADCIFCCEIIWCGPCVQAQIRSEVIFQRRLTKHQGNNVAQDNFRFAPPRNTCFCRMCCCKEDCGCLGCIEPNKRM
jgi:hypothetical protein